MIKIRRYFSLCIISRKEMVCPDNDVKRPRIYFLVLRYVCPDI